jgi:glycerophosphoryl diester phosphodiesterase
VSEDNHRVSEGVALESNGRRVLLKWHMLRRRAGEPPFSLQNLRAGLALGASMEIDIRLLSDGAWACLHDDVLDEETNGSGPVSAVDSEGTRRLRLTGADYSPPLLSDVASAARQAGRTNALLQLDLKDPASALTSRGVASFTELVEPIASDCILSGTDWQAVQRLAQAAPGLKVGYDPYDDAEGRDLSAAAGVRSFLEEVLAIGPVATFYLHHRFVTRALSLGVNPIEVLKANGATVDVWTLDPDTTGIELILPEVIAAGADQITTNDAVGMEEMWERLPLPLVGRG